MGVEWRKLGIRGLRKGFLRRAGGMDGDGDGEEEVEDGGRERRCW